MKVDLAEEMIKKWSREAEACNSRKENQGIKKSSRVELERM